VCKVQPLRQLNGDIVDGLYVRARHIDRKIQILSLDELEDVSSIIRLGHWEVAAVFIPKTVESRGDVCVRLQVNPPCDVFSVGYLTDDELLPKVLVVDHEGCVADYMFDLWKNVKNDLVMILADSTRFR